MSKKKYALGGPMKQWELPSSPSTPGYEDRGDMYSIPQWRGAMYKSRDLSQGWEGYGDPSNLITNQPMAPTMNRPMRAQPTRQLAMDPSDYSIDAVRSQYMHGGYTQRPSMFWDGKRMVKAKEGAYDTMFREGGQFTKLPLPQKEDRYGLALYQQGGFANLSLPQKEDRYGLALYQQGGYFAQLPLPQKVDRYGLALYGDGGIHINPANKGKFTSWAQSHGMGVQEAANKVMANKENYSPTIVKRANFAKNAAGWSKKYGGTTMYDAGGDVPLLPSANNPWGSSVMNTQQQMQDVYQPVQDANQQAIQIAPNQMRAPITPERANMNEQPVDASGFNNPYQSQEQQAPFTTAPMQPKRPYGTGYRNLLGAAMIYGQYAANQRQNKNLAAYGVQQGMTQMNPVAQPFSKGAYNQQGQVMGQYGGKMMNKGGMCYEAGGVYEVDEAELKKMKMGGYTYKLM